MFEIEFPTKLISRNYNVSKIKKTAETGYLYMIRPSYYCRLGPGLDEARTLEAEARTLDAKAEAIQFWPSKLNKF